MSFQDLFSDLPSQDELFQERNSVPAPTGGPPGQQRGFWENFGQGFGSISTDLLKGIVPAIAGAGASALIGHLMPGTSGRPQLIDTRSPEAQAAAGLNLGRLQNLQANPSSFGLPGDPNDVNTPAGQKLYQIRKNRRSADAARGALETGGSALRETEDVNTAIANEYNAAFREATQGAGLGGGYALREIPAKPNPWAMLFSGVVNPAVKNTVATLLNKWL